MISNKDVVKVVPKQSLEFVKLGILGLSYFINDDQILH